MAILSPTTTPTTSTATTSYPPQQHHHHRRRSCPGYLSLPRHPHRPFLPPLSSSSIARLRICHAALSPPPPSDPPPERDPGPTEGVAVILSRLRDRVQIFLAVLFWLSLFFWSSAWDGSNNDKGGPNKGSKFFKK
ncbi:hypothetical protein Tsubulata_044554 [Turnera subulata]|uniref:Transmembrane protein n=1 Tax=Turnera subulata TaxID=218843 RepID=A0A9Q0J1R5_9ROSI|nr:hypothetical protein Tsubulata_044554 [Turnera subulata]